MAINLSTYNKPMATARKTLHATAGNLDILTVPSWCKFLEIKAAGSGAIKITHTGAQDAAIGTDYFQIANGGAYIFDSVALSTFSLRLTGTVNSDTVEFVMKAGLEG